VGTEDTSNCKLNGFTGCQDNDLATYCPAMLQGNNRLDRILNWKMYLRFYYNNDNIHNVVFAEGVVHDPVQMLKSPKGKCVIFHICPAPTSFPGHTHDGDTGQVNSGGGQKIVTTGLGVVDERKKKKTVSFFLRKYLYPEAYDDFRSNLKIKK
jgi:hypothetical protein